MTILWAERLNQEDASESRKTNSCGLIHLDLLGDLEQNLPQAEQSIVPTPIDPALALPWCDSPPKAQGRREAPCV